MAQAPKKLNAKRQLSNKKLPLQRVKKQSYKLWFGSSRRLELKLVPAKLTKKQRQTIERRQKYITFGIIAAGIIGCVYFTALMAAPVPAPPALAAPTVVTPTVPVNEVPSEGMPKSEPTALVIPSIGVNAPVITVGKNADNTLEVPSVYDKAGWYKFGPTPGEAGAAVIVGHVTSKTDKAVFWKLGTVQSGDFIEVTRADGTTAKFVVTAVKQFPQNAFPTEEVYSQTKEPTLRLITCGGTYNKLARRYTHNTVVFATSVQ